MESIHNGHKQRLRQKAMMNFDTLKDHEVLELLLNFSIVRSNTNEVAHKLIKKYKTLANVFNSEFDTLKNEKGIGETSACLLTLIPKLIERYNISNMQKFKVVRNIAEGAYIFKSILGNLPHEELYMICLDEKDNIIAIECLAKGKSNMVKITAKEVVKAMLKHNPKKILLGHNHPNNQCQPSSADLIFTRELNSVIKVLDIQFVEHIIVCQTNEFYCVLRNL